MCDVVTQNRTKPVLNVALFKPEKEKGLLAETAAWHKSMKRSQRT